MTLKSSSHKHKGKRAYIESDTKRKYMHMNKQFYYGKYIFILIPFVILAMLIFLLNNKETNEMLAMSTVTWILIFKAVVFTILRISIALCLSFIFAFLLALLVTGNKKVETILLPIFDVLESVPILAFFPIIITFFLSVNMLNVAAIFVIFITMLWSMLFTVIGGIKLIPEDIKDAAQVFGIKNLNYIRYVLFPSVIPELVTGTILSVASGWNIIIVAEVMHVYIKGGDMSTDLLGIGSLLVNSITTGNTNLFYIVLFILVVIIGIINITIWQRLLTYAEKFRFE